MAVNTTIISAQIEAFIKQQQASEQEDADVAIKAFSDKMAEIIKDAILSMTITITPGQVVVTGSPATQSNPAPIILQGNTNLT